MGRSEKIFNNPIPENSISYSTVECPECSESGCGFCSGTGKINFYPSPDAYNLIQIARYKYRMYGSV